MKLIPPGEGLAASHPTLLPGTTCHQYLHRSDGSFERLALAGDVSFELCVEQFCRAAEDRLAARSQRTSSAQKNGSHYFRHAKARINPYLLGRRDYRGWVTSASRLSFFFIHERSDGCVRVLPPAGSMLLELEQCVVFGRGIWGDLDGSIPLPFAVRENALGGCERLPSRTSRIPPP